MSNFLFSLAAGEKAFHLHMPHVWVDLPGMPIDNVVVAEWVIMIVLIAIAAFVRVAVLGNRQSKLRGSLELLLGFLEDWYSSFIGSKKDARKFLPLLATLFLFILISNYMGLIPTVGYPGSLFAPTGRWGTTLGLAIVVALAVQVVAIQELGFGGWIKHLLHLGPLSILEEIVRPFSLSLRLFGNIFGEETLLAVIIFMVPYFAPIPIMFLALLFGAIQAIVFTTLSAIYIGGVLEAARDHGHGHGAQAHTVVHAH